MGPSELHRLLRSLFSLDELTRFLSELPEGDALIAGLPGHASLDEATYAAVHALERRGGIDRDFVARLIAARPGRTRDIQDVARSRGIELSLAEEIEILLGQGFDSTARARLADAVRDDPGTSLARQESMLVLAEIAASRSSVANNERSSLTARLRTLAEQFERPAPPREPALLPRSAIESRADAIYDEIMAALALNEGERAALRLIDLTRLCGGSREARQKAILLSAEANAWRQTHESLRAAPAAAREAWMKILREVLLAADAVNGPRRAASAGDVPTLEDLRAPESGRTLVFRGRAVRKRYPRSPCFQLHNVDLDLSPGMLVGVVGPNGAGKTTLLRVVAGDLAADSGTIEYPALDGPRATLDWRRIRKQIGYVKQHLTPWHGPLAENLHAWAAYHGLRGRENEDAVEHALNRLGLVNLRHTTWSQLSGGFRTRFELARALLPRPLLLVLDEPLAPLDVMAQQRFLRDLRDLASSEPRAPAILISSQHIHEIERFADRVVYLRADGFVEFSGHANRLADDDRPQVFELSGDLHAEVRDSLMQRFGADALQVHEYGIILWATPHTEMNEIVDMVQRSGGSLDNVRNISASVMRLFWEAER